MKHLISSLPIVCAAALLIAFAISAQGQSIPNLAQELTMLSQIPQPTVDTTVDHPGQFMNVIPSQFDPGKTYLVQSSWLSGIGCPPGDPGCPPPVDTGDQHNEGLLLAKTGSTGNNASAVAELVNVKGITLTELGYDIRKPLDFTSIQGSHCGAGAPRFDVVTADGSVHFVGCSSPPPDEIATSNDWIRLRWNPATAFPPILPWDTVQRIVIIFDEGSDTGPDYFGAAILDNIDVNAQIVGRGPTNGK